MPLPQSLPCPSLPFSLPYLPPLSPFPPFPSPILGGYSVFAGVGERTREGNDLYHEMIEGGVISLTDKTSKVTREY